MQSALLRARAHGRHSRTRYEYTVVQNTQGMFEILEVKVEDQPAFAGTGRRFSTLEAAFESGHALARLLIDD